MKKKANVYSIVALLLALIGLIVQLFMYIGQDFYVETLCGGTALDERLFIPVHMIGTLLQFMIYTIFCVCIICMKRNNALVMAVIGLIIVLLSNGLLSICNVLYTREAAKWLMDGDTDKYSVYSLLNNLRGFFVGPFFGLGTIFYGISLGALIGERADS